MSKTQDSDNHPKGYSLAEAYLAASEGKKVWHNTRSNEWRRAYLDTESDTLCFADGTEVTVTSDRLHRWAIEGETTDYSIFIPSQRPAPTKHTVTRV